MKITLVPLLFLMSTPALAQTLDSSGNSAPAVMLNTRPSTAGLSAAAYMNCLGEVSVQAMITFDARGTITDVSLLSSTGVRDVDRAVVSWLRRSSMVPGAAGTARVPFAFTDKGGKQPSSPEDAIRNCDVATWPSADQLHAALSAFGKAEPAERLALVSSHSGATSPMRLVIAWDDTGQVSRISIPDLAGDEHGAVALNALGKTLRMRPGRSGEGFLYLGASDADKHNVKPSMTDLRSPLIAN